VNSFVVNFRHFAFKKGPRQHGQGKFLEIFKKNRQISERTLQNPQDFLEDLGRFLAFFF
jgi:hypothetical protein